METIQINNRSKIYGLKEFDIKFMKEMDDKLFIVFNESVNHNLGIGEYISFRRYVYGDNDEEEIYTANVMVLEKTTYKEGNMTYDAIYASRVQDRVLTLANKNHDSISLKESSAYCYSDFDAYVDPVHRYLVYRYNDEFLVDDTIYYYEEPIPFFILYFAEPHMIFAQDVALADESLGGYDIYVNKSGGGRIATLKGISIPFTGMPNSVRMYDTLISWKIDTCEKYDVEGNEYNVICYKYIYAPSTFNRRAVRITNIETSQDAGNTLFDKMAYILKTAAEFIPQYNPYYYYFMEEDTDKTCVLWHDPWWKIFKTKNEIRPLMEMWINSGDSRVIFARRVAYWNVPMLALSSEGTNNLGMEEEEMGLYADTIIENSIPDVIDMERLKYIPVIGESGSPVIATAITMSLHFRKREEVAMQRERTRHAKSYSKYADRWNISEASASTVWWNGMDYDGTDFDRDAFTEFITASGNVSDLLGYLNFSDDDIYYRKSKLSKSFVRMSFYTSPDPIEQKLLYYSTSFLDATSLYGKYMKQYLLKNSMRNNDGVPLVFFDDNTASARLDTQIVIRNEFNTMMSSEGFNLYLFADDAEGGNASRTIYMKVEFNHAGNGKTIPMIMWPRNKFGRYEKLTASNFLKNLYIPVNIRYIDNKYVYSIPGAENEGNDIRLILWEPKLDIEDD